jgi:hypothetical protein
MDGRAVKFGRVEVRWEGVDEPLLFPSKNTCDVEMARKYKVECSTSSSRPMILISNTASAIWVRDASKSRHVKQLSDMAKLTQRCLGT